MVWGPSGPSRAVRGGQGNRRVEIYGGDQRLNSITHLPAGPARPHLNPAAQQGHSQTAPVAAEPTSLAYFASTPEV